MSNTAITVRNLSKLYRIGARQQRHDTLRDSIAAWFDAPKRWFARNGQAAREDTIWALKDVSFDVKHGEVVGIIGRNGAGKSTLLKILSRITKPTTGSVEIHGRVGSLLEVGTGFHPELTGRENIYLNGAILGMKRAEIDRKFDEIVAFAEIEKFLDTPVKRYSSGMYVRLAFAVAAHLEPEILIVDEVLAVGDAEFQKKCLGKMGDVAKEGRTVLFVSHNMAAIGGLCTESILLEQGAIVFRGSVSTTIGEYLGRALGPINASSCSLENRDGRKGDGPLRFQSFSCELADGIPTLSLVSGERASFVLTYDAPPFLELKNVSVSIVVYSADGVRVANLWNEYESGRPFEKVAGKGIIRCVFPKFPFRTGRYVVELYCTVNEVLSDWIIDAASFDVVDGDYYGSGKISRNANGFVFLNHWWVNS